MKLARGIVFLSLLLGACAGNRYSLGSSTAPGDVSEVQVLGRRPRVVVENGGPGPLRVDLDSPDDAFDESLTLADETIDRTLPGPVRVLLAPVGDERAAWWVAAWNARGLRVDVLVEEKSSSSRLR